MNSISRFFTFDRESWARLRESTPLTLGEEELEQLRSLNDRVSLDEVSEIYLPLSRLLSLHIGATQGLHDATATFLGHRHAKVPFLIGMAGSVAVGKSTTARILQALLSRWPDHPKVDLVTTDGFLYPNRVLEERGLDRRKGFPESYDVARLLHFLMAVKSGQAEVRAPIYSHLTYDIVPEEEQVIRRPDVVIVEGLNVLQGGEGDASPTLIVSDFFDISIYVDAESEQIEKWYVERFETLRQTVFQDEESYFHRYSHLDDRQAETLARQIWHEINGPNLQHNILPTRERAHLILEKAPDHSVRSVKLRRL